MALRANCSGIENTRIHTPLILPGPEDLRPAAGNGPAIHDFLGLTGGHPAHPNGHGRPRAAVGQGSHGGLRTPRRQGQRGDNPLDPHPLRGRGQRDNGRLCQEGGLQPAEAPSPGRAFAGGQPLTSRPSGNGKPIEGYYQVDLRQRPARATVQAPSEHRASKKGTVPSEEVPDQPLLPALHRARSDRFPSARAYDRAPPFGDERVQL